MSVQIELGLQGPVDHLSLIWEAGRTVLSAIPSPREVEDLQYTILVAIQEMATNVLRHGYEGDLSGELRVHLSAEGQEFTCQLIDRAKPFDPLGQLAVDLDDLSMPATPGGYGIAYTLAVMSSLDYRREDGQNVLTMTRVIDPFETEDAQIEAAQVQSAQAQRVPGADR